MPAIEQLTEHQVHVIRRLFDAIDTNHDGVITWLELGALTSAFGQALTTAELRGLVGQIDGDGSGTLDFGEFLAWVARDFDEAGGRWFSLIDRNHDGRISLEEARRAVAVLGDAGTGADVDRLFREADTDGDGEVTYDEFFRYIFVPR